MEGRARQLMMMQRKAEKKDRITVLCSSSIPCCMHGDAS